MDLVQLKIKGTVITSRYGTLSSGDILRTDAAYAKHLVEECGAAEYMTAADKKPAKLQTKAAPKQRKPRPKKPALPVSPAETKPTE